MNVNRPRAYTLDGDKALLGEDGQFRTQLVRELSEPQGDVS